MSFDDVKAEFKKAAAERGKEMFVGSFSRVNAVGKFNLVWFFLFGTPWLISRFMWSKINQLLGINRKQLTRKLAGEACEFNEIVPHRIWQVTYFMNGVLENNCLVVKNPNDGTLCLLQAPKPSAFFSEWLSKRGTLTVVVAPDSAHDSFARQWKKQFPEITLLATCELKEAWEKACLASKTTLKEHKEAIGIDDTFDGIAGSTHALLEGFGFKEHISARGWIHWSEYAHVIEASSKVVVHAPCGIANNPLHFDPLSLPDSLYRFLCGFYGYRLMLQSGFMYCHLDAFKPGGEFQKFLEKIHTTADLITFKHGSPLDVKYALDCKVGLNFLGGPLPLTQWRKE